jgi:predicted metal-dependent hydrolase
LTERGQVAFGDTLIEYAVVRSRRRRKTVQITLDPTDGVVVAAPQATPSERIQSIVEKRAGWIVRRAGAPVLGPARKAMVSGESLPYLGRQVRLVVEHADVRRASIWFEHWQLHLLLPAALVGEARRTEAERVVKSWYVARAAQHLPGRVERWARRAGYAAGLVLIRDQRRRWGSCGPDGTLRFNWRIVMAAPALIDYVVVHELAHLKVRSHSADYWAEVARLMPDFKIRRARLRELGADLFL